MNAILTNQADVGIDCQVLIKTLLIVDPLAATGPSSAYRSVRTKLLDLGWSTHRFDTAVTKLRSKGRLFLSRSRKTISFKPIGSRSPKKERCVYCGKSSKKLTQDHVIPKSRGGADNSSNIVMACYSCNQSKRDRTPSEWAEEILQYQIYL